METIAASFADCNTAGTAVVTASLALTATALAVMALGLAFVVRQLRDWRNWDKNTKDG